MIYAHFGKRLLDLTVTFPVMVILAPFLMIIGILIRLGSPGQALFLQPRLGQNGRIFTTYKFRTMTAVPRVPDHEVIGRTSEVTRIGYWLRRFKLDELPQLWNVIIGNMSLVGPRPALPEQLEQYDEIGRKRLEVRPGLTGLAQVSGNIHLTWQERWSYDVRYVEQLSLFLDFRIILKTILVVLLGEKRFLQPPLHDKDRE